MAAENTKESQPVKAIAKEGKYLTFALGKEEYGLEILQVREIIGLMDITPVPQVPDYVRGVINLRGEIIPIIDLKKNFHQADTEIFPASRIVVVMLNEKRCGILVDEVKQVVKVNREFISYTTDDLSLNYSKMVESVSRHDEHLILNLDLEQIVDFFALNK